MLIRLCGELIKPLQHPNQLKYAAVTVNLLRELS